MIMRIISKIAIGIIFCVHIINAQTTGKISGRILNNDNNAPLPGANIILLPDYTGTSADEDGYFNLINVSPGGYTVKVMVIGFETVMIKNVVVSVNRTTSLDVKMNQTVIEGKEVVIYATKLSRKKDQTGTVKNISSDETSKIPI